MEIFHYEINDGEFTPRDAHVTEPAEGSGAWTHAVCPDPQTIQRILRDLGVPREIEDVCTTQEVHPDFLLHEGWRVLSLPVQVPGTWRRGYLVAVQLGMTAFTFTTVRVPYIEAFREQAEARGAETADNPLAELYEGCGRADRDALHAIRDRVEALGRQIEGAPQKVALSDVRRVKRAVVECGNICEDQVFCFASLATPATVKHANEGLIALRRTLLTLISHIDRSFDRLDVRARELEAALQIYYQQRTEDRLRVLTVISAVFMPLTLITGIYGMNFESMPELSMPNAYFMCLGAMAGITVTMLLYFYRRGWLEPSVATPHDEADSAK